MNIFGTTKAVPSARIQKRKARTFTIPSRIARTIGMTRSGIGNRKRKAQDECLGFLV
jgi:hypothetical protein